MREEEGWLIQLVGIEILSVRVCVTPYLLLPIHHTQSWLLNVTPNGDSLIGLVSSLITPTPLTRLSSDTISTHAFFSSTAVSTLNFLDPSTFTPKPREEKIAFMKGLQTVLPRFSEAMRRRKILPSILAEVSRFLFLLSIHIVHGETEAHTFRHSMNR